MSKRVRELLGGARERYRAQEVGLAITPAGEPWMANKQPANNSRAISAGSGQATGSAGDTQEINVAARDQARGHQSIFATRRREVKHTAAGQLPAQLSGDPARDLR